MILQLSLDDIDQFRLTPGTEHLDAVAAKAKDWLPLLRTASCIGLGRSAFSHDYAGMLLVTIPADWAPRVAAEVR